MRLPRAGRPLVKEQIPDLSDKMTALDEAENGVEPACATGMGPPQPAAPQRPVAETGGGNVPGDGRSPSEEDRLLAWAHEKRSTSLPHPDPDSQFHWICQALNRTTVVTVDDILTDSLHTMATA
jgi:hypothetical protein